MPAADLPTPHSTVETLEITIGRLREASAVFDAIDAGELLSVLPHEPVAAHRHQAAVSLLAMLRRDLDAIANDLATAHYVTHAMLQLAGPPRRTCGDLAALPSEG
jgi:hypothetical protein